MVLKKCQESPGGFGEQNFFLVRPPPDHLGGITGQKEPKILVKWPKNRVLQKVLNEVALYPPHGLEKLSGITRRIRGTKNFLGQTTLRPPRGVLLVKNRPTIGLICPKNRILEKVICEVALYPPHGLEKLSGITWRIRGTKNFLGQTTLRPSRGGITAQK